MLRVTERGANSVPLFVVTLHMVGLWNLTVAKPIYDLLVRDPDYFGTRAIQFSETFFFAITFSLIPPTLVTGLLAGINRLSARAGTIGHYSLIGFFSILYAQLILNLEPMWQMRAYSTLISAFIGSVLALLCYKLKPLRKALTACSFIGALSPILFLIGVMKPIRAASEVERKLSGLADNTMSDIRIDRTPPIVMIVFDEFPLMSLLDEKGEIDARSFPRIAEFSETSYWFRNARSVGVDTLDAVPSLLTGLMPQDGSYPTFVSYPDNLLNHLDSSYVMTVGETSTHLYLGPNVGRISPDFLTRFRSLTGALPMSYGRRILPDSVFRWFERALSQSASAPPAVSRKAGRSELRGLHDPIFKSFVTSERDEWYQPSDIHRGRNGRFEKFINGVRPSSDPTFNYLHILLPHAQWNHLPSGKLHNDQGHPYKGALGSKLTWKSTQYQIDYFYGLYLLQVALCDRLLGELFDHMKAEGLFTESLIIIVADHGAGFREGDATRTSSVENIAETLFVPFFIKLPQQTEGIVSRSEASIVDLVPTISSVLGLEIPWSLDGRSLLADQGPESRDITFVDIDGNVKSFSDSQIEASLERGLNRLSAWRSSAEDETGSIYHYGPMKKMMGLSIDEMEIPLRLVAVDLSNPELYDNVDLLGPTIPTILMGKVLDPIINSHMRDRMIVALNGIIQAPVYLFRDGEMQIRAILPEAAFVQGENVLKVYLVEPIPPESSISR